VTLSILHIFLKGIVWYIVVNILVYSGVPLSHRNTTEMGKYMNNTGSSKTFTIHLGKIINSENSAQLKLELFSYINASKDSTPVLDAQDLAYISSAGLRILDECSRKIEKKLRIINLDPEIYSIFKTTGYTSFFDIHKKPREISVENCTMIGEGAFGKVYRLDAETIVKVYPDGCTWDFVEKERQLARSAFLLGIPTAISFDVVHCNGSYGLVSELFNAKTVASIISEDRSKISEYADRLGSFLRELHEIEVPEGMLPNYREVICSWFNDKVTPFLSKNEADAINDYLNFVPAANTFLHCDYHAKNVMEVKGELMLIDIGNAAVGHPVFDLAHMAVGTIILAGSVRSGFLSKSILGYDPADAELVFNRLLMAYLRTDDTAAVEMYKHTFMPMAHLVNMYHASSYLNTDTLNPGIIRAFLRPEMFSELDILNRL
jgi:uncharacterized protein (TIGR02172 family)